MEVSMARASKCVAVRRGDFDEWSNVGVRSDGHERKTIVKRIDSRTLIVTGGVRGMGASHARGFIASVAPDASVTANTFSSSRISAIHS